MDAVTKQFQKKIDHLEDKIPKMKLVNKNINPVENTFKENVENLALEVEKLEHHIGSVKENLKETDDVLNTLTESNMSMEQTINELQTDVCNMRVDIPNRNDLNSLIINLKRLKMLFVMWMSLH